MDTDTGGEGLSKGGECGEVGGGDLGRELRKVLESLKPLDFVVMWSPRESRLAIES